MGWTGRPRGEVGRGGLPPPDIRRAKPGTAVEVELGPQVNPQWRVWARRAATKKSGPAEGAASVWPRPAW